MTTEASGSRESNRELILLTILLAGAIVLFELWLAATNHTNSRDQHLGGAVAYAKGHIDLLRPMLLGFTVNGTPTPLEFPVWQACVAVLMKCFGLWYGWGNVVSLVFFFSSLWALFDLCRRVSSSRIAWWAMIFSLVQPLSWMVGGQAGGDSTAWAFAMWFIYAGYRMMSEGKWSWWIVSLCAAGLSATTKAPFFMTAGLTTFFWLLRDYRRSGRAWFFLISAGIVGVLLFLAWNFHCHRVYAEADFSTLNLDPFDKKGSISEWYFGPLGYRFKIANWARGTWHLMGYVFGGLALIFLMLTSIRIKKSVPAWLWLLAAGCTTLVFPALIWEHTHYFFVYAPVTAWLCAVAAAEIELQIRNIFPISTVLGTATLLVALIASLIQALTLAHVNALLDPYLEETGKLIQEHTTPQEKIVFWGLNWGEPFLEAHREGFTGGLDPTANEWINDPQKLKRLKELGYTKIILLNYSPLKVALTSTTLHAHGKADDRILKPMNLHEHLPAVAKNWPVVFDSPQMLIVQIPDSPSGN